MADEVIPPVVPEGDGGTPPADDGVQLPSDIANKEPELTVEEWKAKYAELETKNLGAEEIAKKLKDEKSQNKRDDIEADKVKETESAKQEFITANLDSFIENGMVATPEQIEEAAKHGISPEQIELAAYKSKENIDRVHGVVGGKEQYDTMMDFMSEHLTDAQKADYTKGVTDSNLSEYAVKGLQADYVKLSNGGQVDNRIVPSASNAATTTGSYKTEAEYFSDKRAADKLTGTARTAMMTKISAKLSKSSIGKQ